MLQLNFLNTEFNCSNKKPFRSRQWFLEKFRICLRDWKGKTKSFKQLWDSCYLLWMVFTQRGLCIGILSHKMLFSLKVVSVSFILVNASWWSSIVSVFLELILFAFNTEQVLVYSRLLILELQQIWEWVSTIFQRSFSWILGIFFSTTQSS